MENCAVWNKIERKTESENKKKQGRPASFRLLFPVNLYNFCQYSF